MKKWYKAVCDQHKEMCDVFVDGPRRTAWYLLDRHDDICAWLNLHVACDLRLIERDDQLDWCFERGYESIRLKPDEMFEYVEWLEDFATKSLKWCEEQRRKQSDNG